MNEQETLDAIQRFSAECQAALLMAKDHDELDRYKRIHAIGIDAIKKVNDMAIEMVRNLALTVAKEMNDEADRI